MLRVVSVSSNMSGFLNKLNHKRLIMPTEPRLPKIQQFLRMVRDEEQERSVKEWADIFDTSVMNIRCWMYRLRKRGLYVTPVNGIVRYVNEDKRLFAFAHAKHSELSENNLMNNVAMTERLVHHHPSLLGDATKRTIGLLNTYGEKSAHALGLKYEPSPNLLANK